MVGLPPTIDASTFTFLGFLPRKENDAIDVLSAYYKMGLPIVFFECQDNPIISYFYRQICDADSIPATSRTLQLQPILNHT